MLIPATFLGSSQEVRKRIQRLFTNVARGQTLVEQLRAADQVDTADVPDALVWFDVPGDSRRVGRSAAAVDFRLALLNANALARRWAKGRILYDTELHALYEATALYFEQSAWGSILLNVDHSGWLGSRYAPLRKVVTAVLRGIVTHWDELTGLEARLCSGFAPETFAFKRFYTFSRVVRLAGQSLDLAEHPTAHVWSGTSLPRDIRPLIAEFQLVERLEHDDKVWAAFVTRYSR